MNSSKKEYLKLKDFSVSNESFTLLLNEDLNMLVTHPQPSLEKLPSYYESEDYISHTDHKRGLFEKAYHAVKKVALKNKLKIINTRASKGSLLDIGAGTGDFLLVAKNNGWTTLGIEPNEKAKNNAILKGIDFIHNLTDVPSHSQDVITMWHVLEHVPDLNQYLIELKRILKPNGIVFIAVPNFNSYDAKHYKEFWAAFDVPRHLWHFSKYSIKKLFARVDMELTEILPMKWDSYYVSLLSEKYKTGRMNYISAIYRGWISNRFGKQNLEYSSHIYVLKNKK